MAVAAQEQLRHAACLEDPTILRDPARGQPHCDQVHGQADGSSECSLPDERAAVVNAGLDEAERRCLAESSQAGRP